MTAHAGTTSGSHAQLRAGAQLGEYVLGQPLWPLRIADAYRANGPKGPATVYVIKAAIAAEPTVRDEVIAGTRAAAALPEHKHLVHTLAAGLTGDILWIATEEVDGSLVRDMLLKKKQAGSSGLGARGAGNLITGVTAAMAEVVHGALSSESVVVNRQGRIRVTDLALGPGTLAAMRAGLIPMQSCIAPEVQASGAPSAVGDVYSVGALLYESLVGSALERFWTALDTTDFPGEPDLAGPPGAATRSLTIGPDPDGPTAYLGSRGLSAKPGYANAFFILDTVIRQLSKDRITGVPPSESIVEGTEEVST